MQYVLPCLRSLMKIMTVNFSISRRFWSGKCLCCHSRDFLIEFQMVGRRTGGDKKKRQRAEDINNSNQESAELKSSLVEILSSFSSLFSSPYFSICCLGWRDYLGLPDPPVPCPGKHSALRYTLIFFKSILLLRCIQWLEAPPWKGCASLYILSVMQSVWLPSHLSDHFNP